MSTSPSAARESMLKSQVLTGHVLDAQVLEALMGVARERFVPVSLRGVAYVDEEIPLGQGRFLMDPLTFARLVEYAAISGSETVLYVGAGTGYGAAVIAGLARRVVALEENAALTDSAQTLLAPYPNVALVRGALAEGWPAEAPFDAILIEGSVQIIPQALADQLREGGRLLTVEHDADARIAAAGLGKLVEYRKLRAGLYKTVLCDASVPLLASFAKASLFAL